MKEIAAIIFTAVSSFAAYAQNPYEVFGYKSTVNYENKKSDLFRINNSDTISIVRVLAFDFDEHLIYFLDKKDSIISVEHIEIEKLLRWLSVDPLTSKFPAMSPYNYAANNPIYYIDPDGRSIKPSTGQARDIIQGQINAFNQNQTLRRIFGGASYGTIGAYNDPNGGGLYSQNPNISGFSLSGITYSTAQSILNNDPTGLSTQEKLQALSWFRALTAENIAEIAVYNSAQTTARFNTANSGGVISDNTFISENPALSPFINAMTFAGTASQKTGIIVNFVGTANQSNGVPFLPNGPTLAGLQAPNFKSATNQTYNIVGLFPVNGNPISPLLGGTPYPLYQNPTSIPLKTPEQNVSNAVINFGVSQYGVSVSDQQNTYRMNQDATITTIPK